MTDQSTASLNARLQEITEAFKQNPLYQPISDILYWRDLVESGLSFAVVNFFFLLLLWGDYSLLTLVSYLLLSFFGVSFLYIQFVLMKSKEPVENPLVAKLRGRDLTIAENLVDPKPIILAFNLALDQLRTAFLFTANIHSLRVGFALWCISIAGNIFSTTTLLYFGALAVFIWPRLYQERQAQIDQYAAIARAKAEEYGKLAFEKLPPAIKKKLE